MKDLKKFLIKTSPVTPSQRHTLLLNLKFLNKIKPLKSKISKIKKTGGRNNQGQITVFTKGGGHKKKYRNLYKNTYFLEGVIESIEYDPNRTANIARLYSLDKKEHFYVLAPENLRRGDSIRSSLFNKEIRLAIGSSYRLGELPLGSSIYNLNFSTKAAGCCAIIISKENNFCRVRLPSGEHRLYSTSVFVNLGKISNSYLKLINLGKAGRSRWLGIRPSVRGVAMNPIDHPHGGGEGKTSSGRPCVTPWGKLTKGQPTRKQKNKNKNIVKKRIK